MVQYYVLKQDPLKEKKYSPYLALGISTDLRIGADLTAERTREGETSIEPKSFSVKDQREAFNVSALAAIGVKTRFAGGLIIAEFRYTYGLTEVNSHESAYNNQDLYLTYGVPNTIFKLNSMSFSVTYLQNIFKPKKLTLLK